MTLQKNFEMQSLWYDLRRFQKIGRLGCSFCYDAFAEELNPLMRRIHGSTEHRGKIPKKAGGKMRVKREIEELKYQLEKAIKEEAYEKQQN